MGRLRRQDRQWRHGRGEVQCSPAGVGIPAGQGARHRLHPSAWPALAPGGATYLPGPPEFRAQVYVFMVHTETDPDLYDVFNPDQWRFRVVPRSRLIEVDQSSIRDSRLKAFGFTHVPYAELSTRIDEVGQREEIPEHPQERTG